MSYKKEKLWFSGNIGSYKTKTNFILNYFCMNISIRMGNKITIIILREVLKRYVGFEDEDLLVKLNIAYDLGNGNNDLRTF